VSAKSLFTIIYVQKLYLISHLKQTIEMNNLASSDNNFNVNIFMHTHPAMHTWWDKMFFFGSEVNVEQKCFKRSKSSDYSRLISACKVKWHFIF
jgi:hypothetical protein